MVCVALENGVEDEVTAYGRDLTAYMARKLSFDITREDMPDFEVNGDLEVYYKQGENKVHYGSKYDLLNGECFGEEVVGHYFRGRLRPDAGEKITDEFFGWLGQRLFHYLLPESQKKEWFPNGAPSIRLAFLGTKKMVVKSSVRLRSAILDALVDSALEPDAGKQEKIIDDARPLWDERKDILVHYRGYEFAERVDLSKIKNWKKLYSMSDREVRMKFFRQDPDYSGFE
jgi:hypothetical protein